MFIGENYYDSIYFLSLLKGKVVSGVVFTFLTAYCLFFSHVYISEVLETSDQCSVYNHEYALILTFKASLDLEKIE